HLAVGLALRVADHRSQGVSQRDAVVHEHCQTAGGSEGLQSAEGRRRDSDTGVMTASAGSRGCPTIVSCHCCASRRLALCPRAEQASTSVLRLRDRVATLRWLVSAYAAALVLSWAQAGAAQDTIGRPVTIYVAGRGGGGIDLYARLVGRHIGRHIPGKPTVTVQLMPGAGVRAANYLAEQAPRDGTAMTTFASGPILEPLIG